MMMMIMMMMMMMMMKFVVMHLPGGAGALARGLTRGVAGYVWQAPDIVVVKAQEDTHSITIEPRCLCATPRRD
jgi:hypothetical protein